MSSVSDEDIQEALQEYFTKAITDAIPEYRSILSFQPRVGYGFSDAYFPREYTDHLNIPVKKPEDLPCPRCSRKAAPEHIKEVAGRWECKCWWCEKEWTHE